MRSFFESLISMFAALGFYQDGTVLFEELYAAYPNNVSFKKGLANSYAKLATIYLETDPKKGILNLKEAEKHFAELHAHSPNNAQFKQYLDILQNALKELEKGE